MNFKEVVRLLERVFESSTVYDGDELGRKRVLGELEVLKHES